MFYIKYPKPIHTDPRIAEGKSGATTKVRVSVTTGTHHILNGTNGRGRYSEEAEKNTLTFLLTTTLFGRMEGTGVTIIRREKFDIRKTPPPSSAQSTLLHITHERRTNRFTKFDSFIFFYGREMRSFWIYFVFLGEALFSIPFVSVFNLTF